MFKNKFFLYGLGAGLLTAAIIIQLASLSQHASSEQIKWPEFFQEHFAEISAVAAEQGYSLNIVPTHSEPTDEQPVNDLEQLQGTSEHLEERQGQDESQLDSDMIDSLPSDQPKYEMTIITGMTSIEVAALAEERGLVSDHKLLEDALAAKGLSHYIQIGTYSFPERPAIDDLIEVITKR